MGRFNVEWLILILPFTPALHAIYKYLKEKLTDRCKIRELEQEIKEGWEALSRDISSLNNQMRSNEMNKLVNKKTLTELLKTEAKEADYKEYAEALGTWVKELFEDYQFQLLKPAQDDLISGYALAFQIYRAEDPERFLELFKLAIDRGLTDEGINKAFVAYIQEGNVVDLGEAIISIEGTGTSSILRGDDLQIFISYETEEYKEKRVEAVAKQKEEADKHKEKVEKQRKLQEESYKILTEAGTILRQMSQKQLEENPEFIEQYKKVEELYK